MRNAHGVLHPRALSFVSFKTYEGHRCRTMARVFWLSWPNPFNTLVKVMGKLEPLTLNPKP